MVMTNKCYIVCFVLISLLFTGLNVFFPSFTIYNDRGGYSESFSSFPSIKTLLGFDNNGGDGLITKKHNMLPIRKASQPLSECYPDNLNKSLSDPSPFPLIAVMAASVTRNIDEPSIRSLALFSHLLPSLVSTLDCGFRFVFILGYDEGDSFYDTVSGMNKTKNWFERNIRKPMEKRNIVLTLVPLKVANRLKKPGPVFLAMGREAYHLGADFMYRVNDDSYLQGKWPAFFVSRLMSLTPPYGVIGPSSAQTDDRILTHDFVHKTHLEIFQMDYYPYQLTDWWMDDWISHVYGRQRTFITPPGGNIDVIHYVFKHQRRYKVDYAHEKALPELVLAGQQAVFEWMVAHPEDCPRNMLNSFRESCVQYNERDDNGNRKPLLNVARLKKGNGVNKH